MNVPPIAIQGERGAFSEAAARSLLGDAIELIPCRTFDDVFATVTNGHHAAAIVPIENTLAGSVHRTYELLGAAHLEIAGEVLLRINHHLIAPPGTRLEDVKRVLSHPVALAQCQRFLASSAGIEAVAEYDTAGSVRLVMERRAPGEAAIAGRIAAEVWGGEIVAEDLEDHPQNWTRFLLLARPDGIDSLKELVADGSPKTTVLFRTPNVPGALFRTLAAFALRDINLTKLESRPIEGRPWEYSFYADVAGDAREAPLSNALAQLREMCESVVVLGSYAAASSRHALPIRS